MPMTYETDRGVFFDPNEVKLDKCLKCATPTTRRSPRSIATLVRGDYGQRAVRSLRDVLVLCERCDKRWERATAIGFAGMAAPFAIPIATILFSVKVHDLGAGVFGLSLLLGLVAGIAMYVYALKQSIRVRSIDDDGLIGIDNIHPDVRGEIVAAGMADPRSALHG
jgi:hypothetical protein